MRVGGRVRVQKVGTKGAKIPRRKIILCDKTCQNWILKVLWSYKKLKTLMVGLVPIVHAVQWDAPIDKYFRWPQACIAIVFSFRLTSSLTQSLFKVGEKVYSYLCTVLLWSENNALILWKILFLEKKTYFITVV